jgi:7-cyano-7-deazaguanine synthase in queuosine biosynthesis
MKFKNKFGTIDVLPNTKLFNRRTIGLSMSGGVDSTMLCILLAKTIQAKNLKTVIQPYNGYDIWAPLDSAGLPNIIKFIKSEFPLVDIKWPVSAVFDTQGDKIKDKNTYIQPLVNDLLRKRFINQRIGGISMGPPLEVQQNFTIPHPDAEKYRIQRLPGYRLWNEVENADGLFAPYKHIDKRFIVQCYKDFGYEDLLKQTQSCTDPKGNCGECWWCQERAWAIQEVFGDNYNG